MNKNRSNIIQTGWLHGYFHPILEIGFYDIGCFIRIHWLIRPGVIVFGVSMWIQYPDKSLFHTTCNEVVYLNTNILSAILGTQIYLLLKTNLTFKERCIIHRTFQTKRVTYYSKCAATKGNVAGNWFKIYDNWRKCFQYPWLQISGISPVTLFLKEGISPVTLSLKEPVISYAMFSNQTGHKKLKIHAANSNAWW